MNATSERKFLDMRALAGLQRLRFTARRPIEGSFGGRHSSRRHGGAGEFADFREYSEGEDLRRIDWKVLARTERLYTRLHQDDTNFICTLVLDASGSMRFGEPTSKLEYTQFLATALSQVIVWQQDQVGLAVASDGLREFLPPGGTVTHLARIHEAIEQVETRPVTDLGNALRQLFHRVTRRGVLIVVSDFLVENLEDTFAAIRLFRHRSWEVIALQIVHPDEETLPDGMAYRFEGLENEGTVDCSPDELRSRYRERFEEHASAVRTMALAVGCDFRRVSTAVPYVQTVSQFLVERSG